VADWGGRCWFVCADKIAGAKPRAIPDVKVFLRNSRLLSSFNLHLAARERDADGLSGGSGCRRRPPWLTSPEASDKPSSAPPTSHLYPSIAPPADTDREAWSSRRSWRDRPRGTWSQRSWRVVSLSMALNFAGIPNDPGTLNQFMIQHDMDYFGNVVNWGPTTKDISTLSGKKISFQSTRLNSRSDLAAATQYLDDTVCQKRFPVIVGVNLDANGMP
jgi:hypothetical protein